jgi:rhodanese-related sulfurtransferase
MIEDPKADPATPVATPGFLAIPDALALVNAGQGVLVDVRDPRLYDNLHAAGALSLPLARLEAADGGRAVASLPRDRIVILYCA